MLTSPGFPIYPICVPKLDDLSVYSIAVSTSMQALLLSSICISRLLGHTCMEYYAIVWDPYLSKDIDALEKVQRFSLRMCLKNWSLDLDQLYQQSNLPPLTDRRSDAKLPYFLEISPRSIMRRHFEGGV